MATKLTKKQREALLWLEGPPHVPHTIDSRVWSNLLTLGLVTECQSRLCLTKAGRARAREERKHAERVYHRYVKVDRRGTVIVRDGDYTWVRWDGDDEAAKCRTDHLKPIDAIDRIAELGGAR